MKTQHRFTPLTALGGVAGLLAFGLVHAQGATAPQPKPPTSFVGDFTWMTAPWKDDDKPFIAIERSIDRLLKQGVNLKKRLPSYRAQAIKNMARPEDPYRWAYASTKVTTPLDFAVGAVPVVSPLRQDNLFEVLMRPAAPDERYYFDDPNFKRVYATKGPGNGPMHLPIQLPPPLHSYRYSRMLFISGIPRSRLNDVVKLRQLGDRLLQRNPHDAEVKTLCVNLWAASGRIVGGGRKPQNIEPDRAKEMHYARELVQENPNQPDYLLLLSLTQLRKRDYAATRNTLQRYLKLIPRNAPHRRVALYQLQLADQYQKIDERMKREKHKT